MELLAPPADEPELLGVLGCAAEELELEPLLLGLLGEAELAPPEAEPDFGASLEDELLDDGALGLDDGALGLDEAPADGDEGELLELDELGEVLLGLSPRSHAARPKASATANAIVESFMDPPWVGGKRREQQIARPA